MTPPEAEKAAAVSARGLPGIAELPGRSNAVATLAETNVQAPRRRERELGSLRVGVRREVRIVEINVGGRLLLEYRSWFRTHDGEWRPSREHFTLPAPLFDEFIGLQLAAAKSGGRR